MALVRWDSSRELSSLQAEMNRLFQSFFDTPTSGSGSGGGNGGGGLRRWHPAMDLVETDEHFVLRADLPGLDENDVKIEVQDNVLTVSGERRYEHEAKKDGFYRLERGSGQFSRSLTLPDGIDTNAIAASFDKGVLEVRVPKPERRKPKRIEIVFGESAGGKPAIEGSATSAEANGAPVTA